MFSILFFVCFWGLKSCLCLSVCVVGVVGVAHVARAVSAVSAVGAVGAVHVAGDSVHL